MDADCGTLGQGADRGFFLDNFEIRVALDHLGGYRLIEHCGVYNDHQHYPASKGDCIERPSGDLE